MRKHLPWYLRGLHGAHRIKEEIQRLASAREVEVVIRGYFDGLLTAGDVERGLPQQTLP